MFASHMTINQLSQVQHIVSESRAARIAFAAATVRAHASDFCYLQVLFTLPGEKEPAETYGALRTS
jgi:hypothetical protein